MELSGKKWLIDFFAIKKEVNSVIECEIIIVIFI